MQSVFYGISVLQGHKQVGKGNGELVGQAAQGGKQKILRQNALFQKPDRVGTGVYAPGHFLRGQVFSAAKLLDVLSQVLNVVVGIHIITS